jgi:hypothetical protein
LIESNSLALDKANTDRAAVDRAAAAAVDIAVEMVVVVPCVAKSPVQDSYTSRQIRSENQNAADRPRRPQRTHVKHLHVDDLLL